MREGNIYDRKEFPNIMQDLRPSPLSLAQSTSVAESPSTMQFLTSMFYNSWRSFRSVMVSAFVESQEPKRHTKL